MFSLLCVWINGWVNNREAGDLRRYHAHYDITVTSLSIVISDEIFCFSLFNLTLLSQRQNSSEIADGIEEHYV